MTNQKKLEFRPYSLYTSKDFIEQKLNEGYEEVAFSYAGRWPRNRIDRISRMCVFFSSPGRIETYEHHEVGDSIVIRALKPFRIELRDSKDLKERLEQFCIGIGKRRKVIDVLRDTIGWEFR